MKKRRTTIKNDLMEKCNSITWEEATEQFLDSLKLRGLAYHTRRWHRENLRAVSKALQELSLATEPALITAAMLQEVVLKMVDIGVLSATKYYSIVYGN